MFDLPRVLESITGVQTVPFLYARVLDGELDDTACYGMTIACCTLGAANLIDFDQWRQEYGFVQARESCVSSYLRWQQDLIDPCAAPLAAD